MVDWRKFKKDEKDKMEAARVKKGEEALEMQDVVVNRLEWSALPVHKPLRKETRRIASEGEQHGRTKWQ